MTSSIPARPPRWCATSSPRRISPPSTPSPWGGRWSTPSSPRCRRTPGSISPGTPGSPSSRRSATAIYRRAGFAVFGYDRRYALRHRDFRRIAMDAVTPQAQKSADQHSHVVRPANMEWQKTRFAGCEVKTLLFDRETGLVTALMRLAPGAVLPDHEHVRIEQTYMLEGNLVDKEGPVAGLEVKPGEFVWREPGSRHVAWSPEGGLMLAMFQIPNKFYERDGRVTDLGGADWESIWGGVLKD